MAGLAPGAARGQGFAGCPPERPTLSGQKTARAGESYSLSWTNVLGDRVGPADYYSVERAQDPGFVTVLDRFKTTRPTQTLPPATGDRAILYHRVVVANSCPNAGPALIVSNTIAVQIKSDCQVPDSVGELGVDPPLPPAFSTYVVSWDTGGSGQPGPGGGATGLLFRLRRTSLTETKESVSESGSASFADPPGDYLYQVRAESRCGSAGPWSPVRHVVVGSVPLEALALSSEPKAFVAVLPHGFPQTAFAVRNAGTTQLTVTTVPASDAVSVAPEAFTVAPGDTKSLTATLRVSTPMAVPLHTTIGLSAGDVSLRVPIDAMVSATAADASAAWSDGDADVDVDATPVRRSLVNRGTARAALVSAVNQPWLSVDSFDGQPWDRPLAPQEVRPVRIRVDRSKRRSAWGTEVGVVSITTAGHPDDVASLVVTDDGPAPTVATEVRPSAAGSRTRLLYASMPNAADAHGVGRFTTDLWLSNLDVVSPIEVSLFFSPIAAAGPLVQARRVDLKLGPGETRRYRNIVGKVAGYEGACEVEVRSPATTLSATALVGNTPLSPLAKKSGGIGTLAVTPAAGTTTTPGQYGFEMRPTIPGEGVRDTDPEFVLSGLAHGARRRTNILLTETSGVATTVLVELFGTTGSAVTRDGQTVQKQVTVPALSTVQINDADLFDASVDYGSPYALISFRPPDQAGDGEAPGSVVPFATVIDAGTEDASLRVGASTKSLTPLPPAASSIPLSLRPNATGTAALPFDGGAAPLFFPAAHIRGAPLGNGETPYWKTRVTFTNVSRSEQRTVRLRYRDQAGRLQNFAYAIALLPGTVVQFDDLAQTFLDTFGISEDLALYGSVVAENVTNPNGTWQFTWADVDVQTETYTADPKDNARGDYKTGMEGFSYRHGYSSFQSNLGTVQIDGAENSSRFRTNLILTEVGGAPVTVAVSAYEPGSFVPIASTVVEIPALGYVSRELFKGVLGLDRSEMTDIRVVVRQLDGDGVYMAFASKIDLTTGDPANIFLRPATAGTGR